MPLTGVRLQAVCPHCGACVPLVRDRWLHVHNEGSTVYVIPPRGPTTLSRQLPDAPATGTSEGWRRQCATRSPSENIVVTTPLRALLERLVSQEAARTNAARASDRLIHHRRELEDVEAFLSQHEKDQTNGPPACADARAEIGLGRRPGR